MTEELHSAPPDKCLWAVESRPSSVPHWCILDKLVPNLGQTWSYGTSGLATVPKHKTDPTNLHQPMRTLSGTQNYCNLICCLASCCSFSFYLLHLPLSREVICFKTFFSLCNSSSSLVLCLFSFNSLCIFIPY